MEITIVEFVRTFILGIGLFAGMTFVVGCGIVGVGPPGGEHDDDARR